MVTLIKSFPRERFLEGICVSSVRITWKPGLPRRGSTQHRATFTCPRESGASSRVEDLDARLTAGPTASPGSFPVSPSSDHGPGTAPEALLTRVGHWAHGTPACLTSNSSPSGGRAEAAWLRCPQNRLTSTEQPHGPRPPGNRDTLVRQDIQGLRGHLQGAGKGQTFWRGASLIFYCINNK